MIRLADLDKLPDNPVVSSYRLIYSCRRFWNHYHHTVGRLVLLLAFANIMIGLCLAGQGWGWYLGIALMWLAIWVVGALGSVYNRHRLHRGRSAEGSIPSGAAPAASLNKPVL